MPLILARAVKIDAIARFLAIRAADILFVHLMKRAIFVHIMKSDKPYSEENATDCKKMLCFPLSEKQFLFKKARPAVKILCFSGRP